MIQNDAAILSHHVEEWEKVIPEWVDKHKDKLTARNIMNVRNVGEDTDIDVVQKFDRTGPGAQIIAKGSVPESMGVKATDVKHTMYQIATGFWINARDLSKDPKTKNRLVEIALADIHRKEDDFALNGVTRLNVTGIVTAAHTNALPANKGAWSGETGTDIYDDINEAISLLDGNFEPAYLVGNRKDLRYLFRMDSERQPYYKSASILFGKMKPEDTSWLWTCDFTTRGKVYLIAKDTLAADFAVSENPHITDYPMSPGQNYWIEFSGWSAPEIHEKKAFVEIPIT